MRRPKHFKINMMPDNKHILLRSHPVHYNIICYVLLPTISSIVAIDYYELDSPR